MDWEKSVTRRAFWWILLWCTLLCAGLYSGVYWMSIELGRNISISLVGITLPGGFTLPDVSGAVSDFQMALAPVMVLAVGVFALFLWLTLRASVRKLAKSSQDIAKEKKKEKGKKPEKQKEQEVKPRKSQRELQMEEQRQTLHLLAILQREGRLMDFFSEDLDAFGDAQIGAAVRGVHENCKKLLDKHLKPGPVMKDPEGETVTVEPGFDPSAIKLTGNVSGDPPFTGILRHRGWRASKYDMPSLVTQKDARLIAPAEVEIE